MAGITFNNNYNVSTLFSSLNTNKTNSGIYSSLSELSSIRSGSYRKLLNKYYSSDSDTQKKLKSVSSSLSTSKSSTETLANVRKSAEAVKTSVNALTDKSAQSVFAEKDGEYDKDRIYDAVSNFVSSYNNLIGKASDSGSSSIDNTLKNMTNNAKANSKMLGNIGISIGSDNKLTLDKDAFMKADMNKVKSMLGSTGSFGYQAGTSASMIDYAAQNEAAKSNTYTSVGNYSYNYNAGSLYNYGL